MMFVIMVGLIIMFGAGFLFNISLNEDNIPLMIMVAFFIIIAFVFGLAPYFI